MVDFLASSVKVLERDPSIVTMPELPTAVPGFVGLTELGAVDTPTECSSWDEYVENFGRFYKTDNAETAMVPLAAWCFFLNGGSNCNITRRQTGTPVKATVTLVDRTPVTPVATLQLDAKWFGAYGNNLSVLIEAATNGVATDFNMTILKSGVIVEVWPNITMDGSVNTAANYVETVINDPNTGSDWIVATDLDSTSATDPPDGVDSPALGTTSLASGADGDAIDAAAINGGDNFADLESADITLLACPDLADDALHETMLVYCETTRDKTVVAILDPAAAEDSTAINTRVAALTVSDIWGLYWPRLRIPNPDSSVFTTEGDLVTVPPSGLVCGLMARIDGQNLSGPFTQPAGVDNGRLLGVVDLESDNHEVIHISSRNKVFPNRVNPITWMRGYGIFVDVRVLEALLVTSHLLVSGVVCLTSKEFW